MPNIGTVLREEITRLSRKETRSQVEPTKKSSAQQRKDIAELKRQVAPTRTSSCIAFAQSSRYLVDGKGRRGVQALSIQRDKVAGVAQAHGVVRKRSWEIAWRQHPVDL